MGNFQSFTDHLMKGNEKGLRKNLMMKFVNKIVDNDGRFPIHIACRNGFVDIVKFLLDHKCNIECEDKSGMRPIHYASSEGHSEILKLLLDCDCNIECENKSGMRPIHYASRGGHSEILKLLLDCNCNIECEDKSAWRPIHCAISRGNLEILKLLLDRNCNIECEDKSGMRPIHLASYGGHSEILKLLLQQKCQIDCKTKNRQTALDLAKKSSKINCLELFANGETIKKLFVAIERNDPIEFDNLFKSSNFIRRNLHTGFSVLETAIDNNADRIITCVIDKLNDNKEIDIVMKSLTAKIEKNKSFIKNHSETSLHEAIPNGLEDNYEYLRDRSIIIDQTGFMGLTSLHCAVIRGKINVCAQLVSRGADYVKCVKISSQSSIREITIPFAQSNISLAHTENALTLSIKFHGTLFPCFLDRLDSINTNVHDGENNSLLHLAVKCLQPDICSSLLNAGAQVDSVNNLGNTPLLEMFSEILIAKKDNIYKVIEITNILIKKGANVNIKSTNGITAFQSASIMGSEKLMFALVSNNPKLINFSSIDFQTAFTNHWFEYGEILINLLSDNFLSANISSVTFQSCKNAETKLIKLLFDKSNSQLQQSLIENLLHDAVNNDDNELFDHLIKTEILKPESFENGETLLTFVIKEKKPKFAWKLLESINKLKFVNLRNIRKQSALQMAIEMDERDLMDALIYESEEFNSEDSSGQTVLTQLFDKISISNNEYYKRKLIAVIKAIIPIGGDIYKITSRGQPIIDLCTDINVKEEIEEFFGKIFNKSNERNSDSDKICNICMDNHLNIVFQCGHLFCRDCSDQLFICPICKAEITHRIQIYFN